MSSICIQYEMTVENFQSIRATSEWCSWVILIMAVPTTLMNLTLLIAIVSSKEERKPCLILLTNLAGTDLIAGLFNMPMFFFVFRYLSEGKDPCLFAKYNIPVFLVLGCVSIITVSLIATERYMSIFNPYYYVIMVSHKNFLICTGLSWCIPIMAMILAHTIPQVIIFKVFGYGIILVGVCINLFAYFRILVKAKHVRTQIQNEEARFGHSGARIRDKNLIYIGALITISMLICFSPAGLCMLVSALNHDLRNNAMLLCWSWALILANSFINPIISCSFCPTIRGKVFKVLACPFRR